MNHMPGIMNASPTSALVTRKFRGRQIQMKLLLPIVAGLALLAGGCGEKKSPPPKPADAAPVDAAAPPDAQEKARVAQAVAMRSGIEPPKPSIQLRGGELATAEVLQAYNQQLARKIFEQRDGPETMEELVRKWGMPRLPTPPPGKRIIYDPVNRIIKLDPP